MDYIEYIHNLRAAMKLVASKIPELRETAKQSYYQSRDEDIKISLMSDEDFYNLQTKYDEVEPKLYQFNPDEEYGIVRTMAAEDMRGE